MGNLVRSPCTSDRLRDGGVSLALKARIARYCGYTREAANAEAAKYSGHSGRVGMYTAASEAGIAIEAVAALVRHKSLNVAQSRSAQARAVEEPGSGDLSGRAGARRMASASPLKAVGDAALPSRGEVCQDPTHAVQQSA